MRKKIEALLKHAERQERDEPPEVTVTNPTKSKPRWLLDDLVDVGQRGKTPDQLALPGVIERRI